MRRLEFRAMGCQMLAVVDADDAAAMDALKQTPVWFEDWEAHLSRFRPASELSQLNRAAGGDLPASDVMLQVIEHALSAARASGGLVTPTVLDALTAAGYDRTFEAVAASNQPVGSARVPDWRTLKLDAKACTIRLPRGMHLDLGGTAKGWAANEAMRRLAAFGPALVDAGGDIATSGAMTNGDGWPIAIADPFSPDDDLAMLTLVGGAVATSGKDFRRWERNGKLQHHIVDPRTGQPAETDVLSATVIAPTAMQAEVAAKVALILGSRAGLEWIEARRELAALLVLDDGYVAQSKRMRDFIFERNDL